MWVLLASLWYLLGIGSYLYEEYFYWNEITLGDVLKSFLAGVLGPLWILQFINWDYPIYSKKRK